MKTIVCYGDSNTWGYIPKKEKPDVRDARYDEETRWTGILQRLLGKEYHVVEEGLNGRTTAFEDPFNPALNGLKFIECCMATHAPADLVIVMLGTNDLKTYLGGDAFNIARGAEQIINTVKNGQYGRCGDIPPILLACPVKLGRDIEHKWPYGEFGPGCLKRQEGLEKYLEDVAKANGCYYLNVNEFVQPSENDCVHLDEKGHAKLAEVMEQQILQILGN